MKYEYDNFFPIIPKKKAYCEKVLNILINKLPEELAILVYRLTMAIDTCGEYLEDIQKRVMYMEDLNKLTLRQFNDFIYRIKLYRCFICNNVMHQTGTGLYCGINNRVPFLKISKNIYLYLGSEDWQYETTDGVPFLVFSIPPQFNVISINWMGIFASYVPGKQDMSKSYTCIKCDPIEQKTTTIETIKIEPIRFEGNYHY